MNEWGKEWGARYVIPGAGTEEGHVGLYGWYIEIIGLEFLGFPTLGLLLTI